MKSVSSFVGVQIVAADATEEAMAKTATTIVCVIFIFGIPYFLTINVLIL
jgi:hypothetical protein